MASNSIVTTKLFVGNVPQELSSGKLRELCEPYGEVVECDVIKNYAFVHFAKEDDARGALAGLQGMSVGDRTLRAELSKSSVRQKPGMGDKDECFKCGGRGHWSKDCPSGRRGGGRGGMRGGRGGGGGGGGPMRRGYGRDSYYEEYEGYYRRPSYEDRYEDRYDDYYRRRPYASDYYSYRDRSPYSRPPADYYSRESSYYGFADDR